MALAANPCPYWCAGAPAAIMLAAVMLPPERGESSEPVTMQSPYNSSMDAIVSGTGEGLRLLATIIDMLIVFVALVYLVDQLLGLLPYGATPLNIGGGFWQSAGAAGLAHRHPLARGKHCGGITGKQSFCQRTGSLPATGST